MKPCTRCLYPDACKRAGFCISERADADFAQWHESQTGAEFSPMPKNKTIARKRTVKPAARKRSVKTVKAVSAAATPTETAEVHVHPGIVEIRFNGEAGASERFHNGAVGSEAYATVTERLKRLRTTHAVTLRQFNAQGVAIHDGQEFTATS